MVSTRLTAAPMALATSRYLGLMSCPTPDKHMSLTMMLPPPTRITIASPCLVLVLSIACSRVLLISKSPPDFVPGSTFPVSTFSNTRSVAYLDFQHQLPGFGRSIKKAYRQSGTAEVDSILLQAVANRVRTNNDSLPIISDTRASTEGETVYIWNSEIRPDTGNLHKRSRLSWEPAGEEGTNVCGGSVGPMLLAILKLKAFLLTGTQAAATLPPNIHHQNLPILLLRPLETLGCQDGSPPRTVCRPAREASHRVLGRLAGPAQGAVVQVDVQSTFSQGPYSCHKPSDDMPGKATQAGVDDARIFSFQEAQPTNLVGAGDVVPRSQICGEYSGGLFFLGGVRGGVDAYQDY